eukprot:Selendium_serpulae@DN1316_c0_g1_i1.p3
MLDVLRPINKSASSLVFLCRARPRPSPLFAVKLYRLTHHQQANLSPQIAHFLSSVRLRSASAVQREAECHLAAADAARSSTSYGPSAMTTKRKREDESGIVDDNENDNDGEG